MIGLRLIPRSLFKGTTMFKQMLATTLVALCISISPAGAADRTDGPPNIVLIFIDDQGYQDLGCFGSPNIKTPHIDRMASEGVKFTDFYVAAPICSASRAGLLTGCYCQRVSVTGVYFPRDKVGLNPDEITIADMLKSKGYATAAVGKWHLGHLPKFLPTNNGFDSYFGIPYSNDMDGVKGKNRNLDRAWIEKDFTPWNVPLFRNEKEIERPANQITLTERYTEEAVKFIKTNAGKKPFFLYLPHTMPHIPLFVADKNFTKDPKAAYKATIEEIDSSVGEVLAALKETGVDKNTLVVYTSDNGPWLSKKHHGGSAKPLRDGKFTTFEGGMRVPCVMRWPGQMPAGKTCDQIASTIDLLPTFAAIAGAEVPTDRVIDGKNLTGLLKDPSSKSPRDTFFFYRGNGLQAVRHHQWKLHIKGGKKKATVLYDLSKDIGETTDVSADNAAVVSKLAAMAAAFDKSLKANTRPVGKLD